MKDEEGGAFPATDPCSSVTWFYTFAFTLPLQDT